MYVCITLLTGPGFAVVFTKANKRENLTDSPTLKKKTLKYHKTDNISYKLNQKFNSILGPVSSSVQMKFSNISLHDLYSKLLK